LGGSEFQTIAGKFKIRGFEASRGTRKNDEKPTGKMKLPTLKRKNLALEGWGARVMGGSEDQFRRRRSRMRRRGKGGISVTLIKPGRQAKEAAVRER